MKPAKAGHYEAGDVPETLLRGPFGCVLHMPTGSGKTWLAERAIGETLRRGGRAVYVAPLRALAGEVHRRWKATFAGGAVGVFTGEQTGAGRRPPLSYREARLLVMTPERLDACTRVWRTHYRWLAEVDLLVVDELHLLGEAHRGPRLEGALSRFRRLNPFARVLGLSATLGNAAELADWLEAVVYATDRRPVPLRWRIVRYERASEKPDLLLAEVERTRGAGGSSLVFVHSRRRAEELARFLRDRGVEAAHHHAGLESQRRRRIESDFRDRAIQTLVATATLEMGLNLPARQVVLYDLSFFDGQRFAPLSTNTLWQRAGRAGRRGLDDAGEAVLLAAGWDRRAERYAEGRFEPIRSRLDQAAALAEQIVAEVASGTANTESQLRAALAQSLAHRQGIRLRLTDTVAAMLEAGLIERRETESGASPRLRATRIGHIAARRLIRPDSVALLRRALQTEEAPTFFDLLLAVALTEDCEPALSVDFEELPQLAASLSKEPSYWLASQGATLTDRFSIAPRRLLAGLKMAVVLRAWTRRGDAAAVAETWGCYPFEVGRLAESAARLLAGLHEMVAKPESDTEQTNDTTGAVGSPRGSLGESNHNPTRQRGPGKQPSLTLRISIARESPTASRTLLSRRVAALQRMVAAGLDETAVALTEIGGVGPNLARRLTEAGVPSLQELAHADPTTLCQLKGLSLERARRWIAEAGRFVQAGMAEWEDTGPVAKIAQTNWPPEIDPYRLGRAMRLIVTPLDDGWLVSGGLEPHRVGADLSCDCPDFADGHPCKHTLAVRLERDEAPVRTLAGKLRTPPGEGELELFRLWYM